MEAEIVPQGILAQGLVSSTLPYTLLARDDTNKERGPRESEDQCMLAVSSDMKLVLIVCGYKAQLLLREKFHDSKLGYMYGTVWEGLLVGVVREAELPRPSPTAVAILSVHWEGCRSGPANLLVAGFDDGVLRFYKEDGTLIFSHQLHKEKIKRLTYSVSMRHGSSTVKQEELVVVYQSVVCVVSGSSVVQCVKECFELDLLDTSDRRQLPSLAYKKWHLQHQTETCDVVSLVSTPAPVFDQLSQLSKVKGHEATLKGVVPVDRKIVSVGSQPMLALYNVSKDASSIHMTEVVSALTTALSSAVMSKVSSYSSWLGWGRGAGQGAGPTKPAVQAQISEPTISVSMSCHLPDATRKVTGIWPSPCGRLLVTTDDFGRVLLISTSDFTVLRLWKGYRSAQCGWIEVSDEERERAEGHKGTTNTRASSRRVLCLCIYAAKRGIVELWPVQNGPRVAAFLIGKGCRLLQVQPAVFGRSSHAAPALHAVVFLSTEGQLVSLSIPQHLLLKSGHTHSRDLLLLRKLPQALETSDSEFIGSVFSTMTSSRLLLKAVDLLLTECPNSKLPVYLVPQMIFEALKRLPSESAPSSPATLLRNHLTTVRQIVNLYAAVKNLSDQHKPRPYCELLREQLVSHSSLPPSLAGSLTTALNNYFRALAKSHNAEPRQQHPPARASSSCLSLREFVHCFESEYRGPDLQLLKVEDGDLESMEPEQRRDDSVVQSSAQSLEEMSATCSPTEEEAVANAHASESSRSERVTLTFHPKLEGSLLSRVGQFLFQMVVCCDADETPVATCYQDFGLQALDMLNALCAAWLSEEVFLGVSPLGCLAGLKTSLSTLLRTETTAPLEWSRVGDHCRATTQFGKGLLLAAVSYSFARAHSREQDVEDRKTELQQAESEGWEAVGTEDDEWFHLIQELEFLTRLSLLAGLETRRLPCPALPVVLLNQGGTEGCDVDLIKPAVGGRVGEDGGVEPLTVAHLEKHKSEMIQNSVGEWMLIAGVNPVLLESVHSYREGMERGLSEEDQLLLLKTRQLFQCSPLSLDVDQVRVCCVWQACVHCGARDAEQEAANVFEGQGLRGCVGKLECVLKHLLLIQSAPLLAAAGHLLWAKVFRPFILGLVQSVKKIPVNTKENLQLVSLSRQLLGLLLQLGSIPTKPQSKDFHLSQQERKNAYSFDLAESLLSCPPLNEEAVRVNYTLVMCLELCTALGLAAVHTVKLFDIWEQDLVGCSLGEEPVKKKKGRTISALKHNQMKFLTKALSAYVEHKDSASLPFSHLKLNAVCGQGLETGGSSDVILTTWPRLVQHLAQYLAEGVAEEVGVAYISLLFSSGMDEEAKEAMKFTIRGRLLSERLISVAGQRLQLCLAEETSISKKATASSLLMPQVVEWMSKQSKGSYPESDRVHHPSWKSTSELLNVVSNNCELLEQQTKIVDNLKLVVSHFIS